MWVSPAGAGLICGDEPAGDGGPRAQADEGAGEVVPRSCQAGITAAPCISPAGPGAGLALLVGELLGRVRAELPVIGELGEREQVLVSAWLTGLRSARTRRAYAGDVAAWLGWLADRNTGALVAGRVHVDLWAAATQLDDGAPDPIRRCPVTEKQQVSERFAQVGVGIG